MSEQPPNTEPTPPIAPPSRHAPPPPPRSGCATALMVIVGIILLLPGLCAILLTSLVPGHFGREEMQLVAGLRGSRHRRHLPDRRRDAVMA